MTPPKNSPPSWSWHDALALVVLTLGLVVPRLLGLDQFATADEHNWLTRSANFYYALGQRDFASTYQKEHPGVTTMWSGAAAFLFEYPEYRGSGMGQANTNQFHEYLETKTDVKPLDILAVSRAFLALITTIVLLVGFLYARQLVGVLPAFLTFALIAFEPFYLGHSRLLHLDAALASLMLLSLLAYTHYFKNWRLESLLVSAAAAGLSWLTKSPGFLLIPTIGLISLALVFKGKLTNRGSSLPELLWKYTWALLVWAAVGMVVFMLFWPAMWVNPIDALRQLLASAGEYAVEGHGNAIFFNGRLFKEGRLGLSSFYFYPLTFLWRTTPLIILGLLAALWGVLSKQPFFNKPGVRLVLLGQTVFIIIFTLALTFSAKKFDRYLLPVHVSLDVIAALGWTSIAFWITRRYPRLVAWALLSAVIAAQMSLSTRTYPYYLTYYNLLLGGPTRARNVMQIGWGEGLDRAARYLNQKPDSEHLSVMSWYAKGSFSYFFNGNSRNLKSGFELEPDLHRLLSKDYVVVYYHQWQRDTPASILEYLSKQTPEHSIWINGIEYVRIYKMGGQGLKDE